MKVSMDNDRLTLDGQNTTFVFSGEQESALYIENNDFRANVTGFHIVNSSCKLPLREKLKLMRKIWSLMG